MTQVLFTGNAPMAPDAHPLPAAPVPVRARVRQASTAFGTKLATLRDKLRARVPDKFTTTQLVGGMCAGGGAYLLWGLGVTLFTVGLSVVAASVIIERSK